MEDDIRLELGFCRGCETSLLLRVDGDGHPVGPAASGDVCGCGGTAFERLPVDRAFSHLG